MKTEIIKVSNLKNNSGQIEGLPKNPRILKDDKFIKLKKSLQDDPEMLQLREVIAYDNNGELVVICGNMRLRALKELGVKEVPTKILSKETSVDKLRAYTIKDNVAFGEHSWDDLANEWDVEQLTDWGLDIPDFKTTEIQAEEDDFDQTQPETPKTVLGDLYEIGEHRLLCGDSLDSEQVAKLMNLKKAEMVFTDPPYDLEDLSFTDNMFLFSYGHQFICNSEQRNVDISSKHRELMTRWYAIDFRQAHLIANNRPMNRVDFVVEFRNSEKTTFNNLNDGFTTLIECCKIHSNKGETIHTQEKKVELPAKFIQHFSNQDSIILDMFLGSGSTMVASHQLKRKCYGMELDCRYADVIVKRMITLDKSLIIKLNGVDVTNEWK